MSKRPIYAFAAFTVLFFIASGLSSSLLAFPIQGERKNYVEMVFTFPPPEISKEKNGYLKVLVANCTYWYSPGDPKVPVLSEFIALPPYASLSGIRIEWKAKLGGTIGERGYKIIPSLPAITFFGEKEIKIWGKGKEIWKGMDVKVYNSSAPFPKNPVRVASKGSLRGIKLVALDVFPLQYYPQEGLIKYYRKISVKIYFPVEDKGEFFDEGSYQILQGLKGELYNYKEAVRWYLPLLNSDVEGYLIITTENDYSHLQKSILKFAKARADWGLQVYLLTEKRLYRYTEMGKKFVPTKILGYDPDETHKGQNRTIAIRDWLRDHYRPLHILYVLLIGNPYPQDIYYHSEVYGDLPMLMAYCFPYHNALYGSPYGEVPTDYFYACLNGTWDPDHNGIYLDQKEVTKVNLYPQLFVGRIPFYGNYSIDRQILERLSEYKNYTSNKILAAMAILNYKGEYGRSIPRTDGRKLPYYLGKSLENSWKIYALYEEQGVRPVPKTAAYYYAPINTTDVIKVWNMGIGVEFISAHGFFESCWRKVWVNDSNKDGIPEPNEIKFKLLISSYHVLSFLKPEDCVVYHASCLNAYPEDPHNMIFSMLQRSVGAIGGTRLELYYPGTWTPKTPPWDAAKIGYLMLIRLLKEKEPLGEAITLAKLGILKVLSPKYAPYMVSELIEISLYGDPALSPHKPAAVDILSLSQLKEYAVRGNGSAGNPYVIENLKVSGIGYYYGICIEGINVHVLIENVTVSGNEEFGIFVEDSSNITFSGVKVVGARTLIGIFGSREIKIQASQLSIGEEGVLVENSEVSLENLRLEGWGLGIDVEDSNVTLKEVSMKNNGILFVPPGNLRLSGTVTLNGRPILYLEGTKKHAVTGEIGEIIAYKVKDLKVMGAKFSGSWIGIEMVDCSNAVITNTYFSDMEYPIYVESPSTFMASKDVFTAINGSCLYFRQSPLRSYLYCSYISYFNSLISAPSLGLFKPYSPSKLEYSYNNRKWTSYVGNYYYGKPGEDRNGDGIVDKPIPIPCEIGGRREEILVKYPLTYSLAEELEKGMDFPPRILKISPSTGYFKESEIKVTAWIKDRDLKLVLIGGKVAKKIGEDEYSAEVHLVEGINLLKVKATDLAGNLAIEEIKLIEDRTPPRIHVILPPNGYVLNSNNTGVIAIVFDKYINRSSIELLVNGVPVNFTYQNSLLEAMVWLKKGENWLEIKAEDLAGNVAKKIWSVYVDTVPPEVNVTYPKNGQFFNYQSITVDWVAKDNYRLRELLVDVNGICAAKVNLIGKVDKGNLTVNLPLGRSRIEVEVVDWAGNFNETSINVTVDKTPPTVEILWPKSGMWINRSKITVYAKGSDNYGIAKYVVEVNGKVVEISKGSGEGLACTLHLPQGRVYISVVAYDFAGNYGSDTICVYVDYTPPTVEILGPNGTLWERKAKEMPVVINWTGHDNTGIKEYLVYLNGKEIYKGDKTSLELNLPPGKYSLEVKAIDIAGNVGIAKGEFEIKVDSSPPQIELFLISLPKYTNESSGNLTWKVVDNGSGFSYVEILINGKEITKSSLTSGKLKVNLPQGKDLIEILAYDKVGNSVKKFIEIWVDKTPPELEMRGNGIYFNGTSEAVITVNSRDNVALGPSYIYLDGKLYEKKELNGTSSTYLVRLKGLSEGWHTLEVVQFDKAGNFVKKEIVVCFDYIPPKVEISTPKGWINTTHVVLSWNCSDSFGVREVEIYFNGKEFRENASGEICLEGVEGKNVVKIGAEDVAGNWNWTTKEFYIDTVPPKVTLTSPEEGQVIKIGILASSARVSVNWTGHDNTGIKEYLVYLNGKEIYKGDKTSLELNLPPGKYSLEVKAIDIAGNVGIAKGEFSIEKETIQYVEIAAGVIVAIFIIYEIFRRRVMQK